MNSRLVNSIIIGITIALIGLMYIQIRWIKQNYGVREERFDQGVYVALSNVQQNIERNEATVYFGKTGLPDAGKTINTMYDTVQSIKSFHPKINLVDSVGQHALKFGFSDTSDQRVGVEARDQAAELNIRHNSVLSKWIGIAPRFFR